MSITMIINFDHERLRLAREQKGFKSAYALAKKMQIATHQVERAEKTGKITITTFLKFCEVLEVHPASFFTVEYIENGKDPVVAVS